MLLYMQVMVTKHSKSPHSSSLSMLSGAIIIISITLSSRGSLYIARCMLSTRDVMVPVSIAVAVLL